MATVRPFRALHPTPTAVACVAAPPYDIVTVDEARALAQDNALSFLHVSRAEIDLPAGTPPYADQVYERAAARFEALKREAPLVRDEKPALYVYRLQDENHVQTGVAGCYSLDEYESGCIKKHERTRPEKEDDRTRHILALGAQTGLVFLIRRPDRAIDAVVVAVCRETPLFDFQAMDGVRHVVWRVGPAETDELIKAFSSVAALYIADGHHRAAGAARARRTLASSAADGLLAVTFPASELRILPYNRVIKDLAGWTPDGLLVAMNARFTVRPGTPAPQSRGEVSMYLAGKWHTVGLGSADGADDPTRSLDVRLLQDRLLGPLLGIGDPRTDPRIDFVGGARGAQELERLVDQGRAQTAFSLYPVSVSDLMTVADAGRLMPPKSTWFEPKLLDGILVHEV